jgi:hypothetical protein
MPGSAQKLVSPAPIYMLCSLGQRGDEEEYCCIYMTDPQRTNCDVLRDSSTVCLLLHIGRRPQISHVHLYQKPK